MKFLFKSALLLGLIAIGTVWHLLRADGKAINWRNIAELPDLRPPRDFLAELGGHQIALSG